MSKSNWLSVIACSVFVFVASDANAGIIATYNNRALFEADVAGRIVESFDSFTSDTTFHNTSLDVGDFSLHSIDNNLDPIRRNKIDVPAFEFGLFNLNGSAIVNVSVDPGKSMLVTFEDAIMAFGADFAHLNDGILRALIIVDGQILNSPIASATDKRFFGFTSDTPFNVVEFRGVVGTGGDGFGMDDVTYSHSCGPIHSGAVPEPSTLFSFAALLTIAGGMRRRR